MNNSELHKIAPTLDKLKRQECFVIPENYFENVSLNIEYLLLQKKKESFKVNSEYFNQFPDSVCSLLLLKKHDTFKIPLGYFDRLNEQVIGQTYQLEKTTLAAPEGYFDSLPRRLQQRIYEEEQLNINTFFTPKYKYVLATIAACLVVFFGVKLFFNTETNQSFAIKKDILKNTDAASLVAIISTKKGLEIKVSSSTQKQIEKHIDEQLIQNIDENMLMDELAVATDISNISRDKTNNEIQDYLVENNVDESILIEAIN